MADLGNDADAPFTTGMDIVNPPSVLLTPDAGKRAPVPDGQVSGLVFRHGTMELRWHAPAGGDPQVPHDRDELYVLVAGSAVFVRAEEGHAFADDRYPGLRGEERVEVQVGHTVFVPAGVFHRFEDASHDFGAWAVFYGPEGGEQE